MDHQPCDKGHRPDAAAAPDDWRSLQVIDPLRLAGNEHVADLIDNVYAKSGFNARRLAEGAALYKRMIDDDATIAVTMAGAMTPIGMSGVIISLMEAGFVDFIISTGANLYHDLHRAYNMPMVQGDFRVDDNALAEQGVARIYDVFIHDDETLARTDKIVLEAIEEMETTGPFSSAALHDRLGRKVGASAGNAERSLVAAAARLGIPVYTSSPGDSSIGMNLVVPHLLDVPRRLDPVLDVIETAAIVRDAGRNGAVVIGGGSPKNFYLQTQPTLRQILYDESKGGHDYVLQLTVDSPHWGGLSGATPAEARSWGKLKDAYDSNVVVYSCASLTLPLIAQYVLNRCQRRRQRRIYDRLAEITAQLRASAKANVNFRAAYKSHFGID